MSESKLKIIRIISGLWPGGVEKKLTALLPRLKERGIEVSVICLREEGELAGILRRRGVPVVVSPMPSRWSPGGLKALRQRLLQEAPDVVHTHMYRSNISGVIAAKLARVPVVVSNIHNVDSWDDKRQIITDRLISRLRDCTVCVSRGVAEDYQSKVSIPENKLRVIYNGVDIDYYSPDHSDLIDHHGPVIGAAARLVPQKGLDYLVRAASEPEFQNRNVRFCIAGDGPLMSQLQTEARETGASGHVDFMGFVDDIRMFYRSIDILAMPSHREGFSNALVEAMACKVAPVATNVGGNAEAISSGHSGIIVPPGDYEAFRNALLTLVDNESQRLAMAESAREAAESFSLEAMADQTQAMYLTLLGKKTENKGNHSTGR